MLKPPVSIFYLHWVSLHNRSFRCWGHPTNQPPVTFSVRQWSFSFAGNPWSQCSLIHDCGSGLDPVLESQEVRDEDLRKIFQIKFLICELQFYSEVECWSLKGIKLTEDSFLRMSFCSHQDEDRKRGFLEQQGAKCVHRYTCAVVRGEVVGVPVSSPRFLLQDEGMVPLSTMGPVQWLLSHTLPARQRSPLCPLRNDSGFVCLICLEHCGHWLWGEGHDGKGCFRMMVLGILLNLEMFSRNPCTTEWKQTRERFSGYTKV